MFVKSYTPNSWIFMKDWPTQMDAKAINSADDSEDNNN